MTVEHFQYLQLRCWRMALLLLRTILLHPGSHRGYTDDMMQEFEELQSKIKKALR